MNKHLTQVQKNRVVELHSEGRKLMQVIEKFYMNNANKKELEKALGDLYAVAGRMAVEQDISWTGLCECAEKHYEETDEN
jgi:phosphoenolpyruvate synthase/pyruvate phosphate dikinase